MSQIKVSNSALVSAFMKELEPESPVTQVHIFCLQKLLYDIFPTYSIKSYLSYITFFFVFQCDFDRLKLSTAPFMERNLEFLIGCMDDLSSEQNKVLFCF